MKPHYLLLSLILMGGCQSAPKQTAMSKPVEVEDTTAKEQPIKNFHEVVTTDLNNDGKTDTITLSGSNIDPSAFQQIEIALNGGDKKNFKSDDGWNTIDSSFLKNNQNAVNSSFAFVYKDKRQFAILLFGYVYGAGREHFNIIYGNDAHFKMVFDQAFETPMKLQQTNDQFTLLGREGWVEIYEKTTVDSLGPVDIGTYDPFSVLAIKTDTVVLDEAASKAYNEEHYLWLGPKASEKLKVYYPEGGGKPVSGQ